MNHNDYINEYKMLLAKKGIKIRDIYEQSKNIIDSLIEDFKEEDNIDYEKIKSVCLEDLIIIKKLFVSNDIKKKNSTLNKYLDSIKMSYNLDTTMNIYNCNSFTAFKQKYLRKIKDWSKSEELIITYPYINSKYKKTLTKIAIQDIVFLLATELVQEHTSNINEHNFAYMTDSLIALPIDTSNRLKLEQNTEDSNYTYNYIPDKAEQTSFIYQIELDDVKNLTGDMSKLTSSICKVLNNNDIKIFNSLLSHRDKNFFENGLIQCRIRDVCMDVFGYVNKRVFDNVKYSAYKMHLLNAEGHNQEDEVSAIISLLGDVIITKDANNETMLTTTVGLTYRNEIISGNITKVYSEALEGLSPDAYQFIFYLQKRRLSLYYTADKNVIDNNLYFEKRISYKEIAKPIIFKKYSRRKIIERIKLALDSIIQTGSILLSYKAYGDFFDLEYISLQEQEIKDLELRLNIKNTEKSDNLKLK